MFRIIQNAVRGPIHARAKHTELLKVFSGIQSGLDELENFHPNTEEDDTDPIFLLSAGWRSGSTLLQRLIMSDEHVLIWGEPYDECGPVQRLAEMLGAFRPGWPPTDYYYDGTSPALLTGSWIANLFPSQESLWRAHRQFHDTLFAVPAFNSGATRWGIKEVRLGAEHARYLRWLYPNARIIFLVRNPMDAYRSYCRYGRSWYDIFPDKPVFTPSAFGKRWRELVEGYLEHARALDALVVRYEELTGPSPPLAAIDEHLSIKSDHTVLTQKVGSSEREGRKVRVNMLERQLLKRAVMPAASRMGYLR